MDFGIPAAERAALEATYEDTATIQGTTTETVGFIDKTKPAEIASGVPCALSWKADSSRQSDAQQDVEYDRVLFIAPELEILPGYFVTINRLGKNEYYEVVGKPVRYATHQQVFLKGRDLP